MLTTDVGGEETRSDREPAYISARQEVVRADVFLFARGPVGDSRQEEEIRRDDEDVDDAEIAHGFQSVREKMPSPSSSGYREESEAFGFHPLPVPCTRHQVPGTRYQVPGTRCSSLDTVHHTSHIRDHGSGGWECPALSPGESVYHLHGVDGARGRFRGARAATTQYLIA